MTIWKTRVFRLTAAYLAVFGITSLAFLLIALSVANQTFLSQAEREIDQEIRAITANFDDFPVVAQIDALETRLHGLNDPFVYGMLDPLLDGMIIIGNIDEWPVEDGALFDTREIDVLQSGKPTPTLAKMIVLDETYTLLVGRRLDSFKNAMATLRNRVLLVSALFLGVIFAVGFFISRQIMREITQMNDTFAGLAMGKIGARVESFANEDELAVLGRNINQALDQNERYIENVRHISELTAHQLLKPLGALRHNLAGADLTTKEEMMDCIDRSVDQIDEIKGTVEAVLNIAELESKVVGTFENVDLDACAQSAISLYRDVAKEADISLVPDLKRVQVFGDRAQLTELCINLITNAIKYSPSGSSIYVGTYESGGHGGLVVQDEGLGIPEEDFDKVFSPMVRLPTTAATTQGKGLGLALVQAVIKRHDGRIRLSNKSPGLAVTVELPRPPSDRQNLSG